MTFEDAKVLIGEYVKVENEKDQGVVTRIDSNRGLIYVLYKRMREEPYPFPEALEQGLIKPVKKNLK